MKEQQFPNPPSWALRFFKWYCNDHLVDAALGDMLELHARRYTKLGKRKANWLFVWNVLQFFQPFAIRQKSTTTSNHMAMFQTNFKIAWRAMERQKMYTAIKIGGFALGLATCIVISLFIKHELSYDKHYKDGAQIYRMYNHYTSKDNEKWLAFPPMVAQTVKNDYPEVEKSGRLIPYNWFKAGNNLFRRDDNPENTYEEGFAYADQSLLEILEIPMVYGSQLKALANPKTVVLSKRKAQKYFPNENPVGKIVIFNDDKNEPYTVGGVMEDFPPTSHLQYDFLISLTGVEFWPGEQTNWCCWNYNVYLKLRKDVDPAALETKLLSMRDKYYVSYLKETGDQNEADTKKYHKFKLQPVKDVYLKSADIDHGEVSKGDERYVWLFGAVACFILALACINFINLSTARSANRAKEVGLRKVVGSLRGYLVRQFLTESILFSAISFVIALLIVVLTLPYFNELAGKTLIIPWTSWWFFPILIGAAIIVGVIAGIYPSFYLSAFKPIDVLKGNIARGMRGSTLRSAMVVFQFTTSIVLIIGTIVIYKQMGYFLNAKIGFDKEQVVIIHGANTLDKQQEAFKNELMKLSQVTSVTTTGYLPVGGTKRDQNQFWREGKSKIEKSVGAQNWYVDEDYIKTMGMKLVEGRNFNRELASDSSSIIINQAMVKAFGFKKPIGEHIQNYRNHTVIGVVEDFNFDSMKGKITPLTMERGNGGNIVAAKVNTNDMHATVEDITKVWNKLMPNQTIRYSFLDESYARMYDDVQRTGNIFASFAILAIVVACLGLFALSAFMVEQRNKEISIRLVLGASINNIFRLLTQNFVVLVIISFIIAAPLAWYMMKLWLQDYEYKTDVTWDIYATAGLLSVIITLATISYQAISAALANPATRLRSE